MMGSATSFYDFEHRGWSAEKTAAAYHDHLSPITMQAIDPLLDAAGVGRGVRVVDVATGAGYAASAAVTRGASVVGVDFSATQLGLARRQYPGIEFREGDATALPLPDASCDAVVSNFGMPHFSDPDAFIGEAFRVLMHGGRIAFSVWAPPQQSVGLGIVFGAVRAHGRMDVPLPSGPDFFLFSDPARCRKALDAAGFHDVTVAPVAQVWRATSVDALFDAMMTATVRTAALLEAQTPEALAAIHAAMREAAMASLRDGIVELSMPAVVAAARKP